MKNPFGKDRPRPAPQFETLSSSAAKAARVAQVLPLRNIAEGRITESDIALALTTPILGQYAPQFGWPDDWGYYWEYIDAYLFVPEVAFAVKMKTRMVFKNGWEIETKDEATKELIDAEFERLRLYKVLKMLTKNGIIWGNGWAEIIDDSEATWEQGMGGSQPYTMGVRPMVSFKPATKTFGFKILDPRTMRVMADPNRFDPTFGDVVVDRYVQRRWQGPLGPSPASTALQQNVEIDLHRDQVLHLRLNRIGGLYGYSFMRESIFALKGYLLMLQYLPQIVAKRADPTLNFRMGGVVTDGLQTRTQIPTTEDFQLAAKRFATRQSGEDIYTDILTQVEEVYKSQGPLNAIFNFMQLWKERIYLGLGIPTALSEIQGGEIKWGTLKFEVLEQDIREIQEDIEDMVNEKIIPRITDQEAEFHFNEITEEDYTKDIDNMIKLKNAGIIDGTYARDRLDIPTPAGEGAVVAAPTKTPGVPVGFGSPTEKRGRGRPRKIELEPILQESEPASGAVRPSVDTPEKMEVRRKGAGMIKEHKTILELHAGEGYCTRAVYAPLKAERYILIDDEEKQIGKAKQKLKGKEFEFYISDNIEWLEKNGANLHDVTLVDFDPFGSPCPSIKAFFKNYELSGALVANVTDGNRLNMMHHFDVAKNYDLDEKGNWPMSEEDNQKYLLNLLEKESGADVKQIAGKWREDGGRIYYASYLIRKT